MKKGDLWIHAGAGNLRDLTEETQEGMRITQKIHYNTFKDDLHITHMQAGMHSVGSFHPFGRAFDIRYPKAAFCSSTLLVEYKKEMRKKLKPMGFDVVFHDSHVHIEYDPK